MLLFPYFLLSLITDSNVYVMVRGTEAINVHSISLACWVDKLFDLAVNIVQYCPAIIAESYGW